VGGGGERGEIGEWEEERVTGAKGVVSGAALGL